LKETTGEDISTRAMMQYFKPLMSWLEETKAARWLGVKSQGAYLFSA
jgi:peptidyl-dipeptidase A